MSITMQWIRVGVNLDSIDAYAVLDWVNDMKLRLNVMWNYVFSTKRKANTYHEHLIQSDDRVSI